MRRADRCVGRVREERREEMREDVGGEGGGGEREEVSDEGRAGFALFGGASPGRGVRCGKYDGRAPEEEWRRGARRKHSEKCGRGEE